MNRRAVSSVTGAIIFVAFTILVAGGLYFYLSHMEKTNNLPSVDFFLRVSPSGKDAFLSVVSVSTSLSWSELKVVAWEGGKTLSVQTPLGTVTAGDTVKIETAPGGLLKVDVIYLPSSSILWQGEIYVPSPSLSEPVKFELLPCGQYSLEIKVLSVSGNYNWNDSYFAIYFSPPGENAPPPAVILYECSPSYLNASMVGPIQAGQEYGIKFTATEPFLFNQYAPQLAILIDLKTLSVLGETLYLPKNTTTTVQTPAGLVTYYTEFPPALAQGLIMFPSNVQTPEGQITASATYSSTSNAYTISVTFSTLSESFDPLNFVPLLFVTPSSSGGSAVLDPIESVTAVFSSNLTAGDTFTLNLPQSYTAGAQADLILLYVPTSSQIASTNFLLPPSATPTPRPLG